MKNIVGRSPKRVEEQMSQIVVALKDKAEASEREDPKCWL